MEGSPEVEFAKMWILLLSQNCAYSLIPHKWNLVFHNLVLGAGIKASQHLLKQQVSNP